MLSFDSKDMTKLEREMLSTLTKHIKQNNNLKLIEAAKICNVSNSKVSKFVRKIGFNSFKDFKLFFSGQDISNYYSDEISRLMTFLKELDYKYVEDFSKTISKYDKIILFGLGPSYIVAQYFAYKLSIITNKNVTYTQFEDYAYQISDSNSLLIILSVTGKFSTFDDLLQKTKTKGAKRLLLLEEYVTDINYDVDYLFQLTKNKQKTDLLAFEKTRTLFFIFLEEVLSSMH